MTYQNSPQATSGEGFKLPSWLVVAAIVGMFGLAWWQNQYGSSAIDSASTSDSQASTPRRTIQSPVNLPDEDQPAHVELTPEHEPHRHSRHPEISDRPRDIDIAKRTSYQVENQTIRNLYGQVVYQGTIDLTPTLERIERGQANRHRNDGTAFQNREGRLPRKPAGYYKEYVHPTPGESGPGPQRIIIGEEGEIWYTGDHYKTFKKIR